MATKVTIALEDDLEGGPADDTVRFSVGGTAYEMDKLGVTSRFAAGAAAQRRGWIG